jgi:hypothetical protein
MAYTKVAVTADWLREQFNLRIQPRLDSGEYQITKFSSSRAPARSGQPPGTQSVIFNITSSQGVLIAKAHAYLLPDGSYGGSGLLDPKAIWRGNTIYYVSAG